MRVPRSEVAQSPWSFSPPLGCPPREKASFYLQPEPPIFQLVPLPFALPPHTAVKSLAVSSLSSPVGSGDAPEAVSSGWTSHGATAPPWGKRAPNPPSQWSPLNPPQIVNVYTYCIYCVSSIYSICFPNTSGFLEWNILFLKPNCLLGQEENSSRLLVFKAIGHKTMAEKVPSTDNMLPKMSNNYLCKGLLRPCFRWFIVLCLVLFKVILKCKVNLCKMQKKGPRCEKFYTEL